MSEPAKYDYRELEELLSKSKLRMYKDKNSAFLTALSCNIVFSWNEKIDTACAGIDSIEFNPAFYLKLTPNTRVTVLVHELWHIGRQHHTRMGNRDPLIWNWACDHVINLDMESQGYSFEGLEDTCLKDRRFKGMSEEQVYNILIKDNPPNPDDNWCQTHEAFGKGDPRTVEEQEYDSNILVLGAYEVAVAAGTAGNIPGSITEKLKEITETKVDWESHLKRFFQNQARKKLSYAKRNRRYHNIIVPKRTPVKGALKKIMCFMDVSGSVTLAQANLLNSEMKYIFDKYKPEEMVVCLFDTVIQKVYRMSSREDKEYQLVEIQGRGGTSLRCVKDFIDKEEPTCVVILSDLECAPMQPLEKDIPVLWVVLNRKEIPVPYGTPIYIKEM